MDWHTENNSHRINHILSIINLLFPHSHYLHIMKMQKYLTILNTRWQIDRLNFIHHSRYLVSSIHTISHPLHITSGHWTHTLPGGTGVMNDGIPGVPCSCPRNSEHLHGIFLLLWSQSTEVVHKQKTVHKLGQISLKICLLYKYLQDNFSLISKNTALVSAIKGKNCQQ